MKFIRPGLCYCRYDAPRNPSLRRVVLAGLDDKFLESICGWDGKVWGRTRSNGIRVDTVDDHRIRRAPEAINVDRGIPRGPNRTSSGPGLMSPV